MGFIKTHRYFTIIVLIIMALSFFIFLNYINKESGELNIKDVINCFKNYDLTLIKTSLENKDDYILMKTNPKSFSFKNDTQSKVLIYEFSSVYDRTEANRLWAVAFDYQSPKSYATYGVKNILIIYLLDERSLGSSDKYMNRSQIMKQVEFDLNGYNETDYYGYSEHWQYTAKQKYYKNYYETPDKDIKMEGKSSFTCELKYLGENNSNPNKVTISYMRATSYNVDEGTDMVGSFIYDHELELDQNNKYILDLSLFGDNAGIDEIEITVEWNGKSEDIFALPVKDKLN